MDHEIAVGEVDRAKDLSEERQSFLQAKLVLVAEIRDRRSVDALEHQPGTAVGGDAAVEQTRNGRMFEAGEDLPLAQEALARRGLVGAGAQELQRGVKFVGTVGTSHREDRAHTAAAELTLDLPSAQTRSRSDRRRRRFGHAVDEERCPTLRGRAAQEPRLRMGSGERRFEARMQRLLLCGQACELAPRLGLGQIEQTIEQRIEPWPGGFARCRSCRGPVVHRRLSRPRRANRRAARALSASRA